MTKYRLSRLEKAAELTGDLAKPNLSLKQLADGRYEVDKRVYDPSRLAHLRDHYTADELDELRPHYFLMLFTHPDYR